ncbi:MAG: D-Ala-D-Ala carboxypeptidase family metallohydrolase [bacterium]
MKLSPHFTLAEFSRSETAARRGLPNQPGAVQISRMRALCQRVLEPVREHFAVPVTVVSGYRSLQVNRAVGGSRTSQHMQGEAADITVWGYGVVDVYNWIAFYSGLDYDQIIHEFGSWVHISFTERRPNRNMALRAYRHNGTTRYARVYEPLDRDAFA